MNAGIDQNSKPTIIALLNTDGATITPIKISASNHGIEVSDGTGGSDNGGTFAKTDENGRTTWVAESSNGSGALVALYVDSTGHLLINSM